MDDGHAEPEPFLGPDLARFPSTRLRTTPLDDAAPPTDGSPSSDPDTCRICRGEGTEDEPLFYPCKCSGSIKYVHQDCLMEWLSHSQKKHCELCKTPFRFTKLYAPDMPKQLPILVFLRHVGKYMLHNIAAWLRAVLVASVWLGWLPYLMRSVWSFLFWISDEGLSGGVSFFGRQPRTAGGGTAPGSPLGAAVCPSSPLFAATSTVATVGGVLDGLSLDSLRLVRTLYNFNLTSADPLYSTILRLLFGSVGTGEKTTVPAPSIPTAVIDKSTTASRMHPSLLSDVGFLRNLTRHNAINRTIIATFEGQIITILVIVCFVLIILVRDYVVQQQPDIMRAAFAPVENAPEPHPEPIVARGEADHIAPPVPAPTPEEPIREDTGDMTTLDRADHEFGALDAPGDPFWEPLSPESIPNEAGTAEGSSSDHLQSWNDPDRYLKTPAGEDNATVHEYLKIYREADGDMDKIVKIARELGLDGKLDYWIRLTKQKIGRGAALDDEGRVVGEITDYAGESSTAAQVGTSSASASSQQSSDWIWTGEQLAPTPENEKGKGKDVNDEDETGTSPIGGGLARPRANTDGPKINDAINPYANNNWSFANVPVNPSPLSPLPSAPKAVEDPQPSWGTTSQEHATSRDESGVPTIDSAITEATAMAEDPGPPSPGSEDRVEPGGPALARDVPEAEPIPVRPPVDAQQPRRPQVGFFNRMADFMWRGIDDIDPAELAAVEMDDFADDLGVMDQDDLLPDEMEQDREVVEAAVAAGLDPEAIEDAEDLEGILELLGMRGPVAGLFQNAIFCAFLVSISIFMAIFFPYNIGRITLWMTANPMRPARMLFSVSKFIQDCAVIIGGVISSAASLTIQMAARLIHLKSVSSSFAPITTRFWDMTVSASNRISASFTTDLPIISASEMRNFSAISHEALLTIRGHVNWVFSALGETLMFVVGGNYSVKGSEVLAMASNASTIAWSNVKHVPAAVANPSSWVINLSIPEPSSVVNPELAYWGGVDRFWAIISGYVAMSLVAGIYLRRGAPFSSGPAAQEWEGALIDGLNQASGVMKVILIIGIEMLVFPLYCGMLLDIALLPLFEGTTMASRLQFTVTYPVTSVFVHWFVGTGYMFHFALFVSMCRKIMRKGVLYFIRDPDDPEFHPVRDVLERSVTTQLRKILFSAFVYGALVIICLGGVVWGLSLALPTVLPIHYSSNEPVLEFPIDLLFYNFLMPLAVKFFRPSDGLHAMYTWWFRKCARALRITWFLFGERRVDEEGKLFLKEDSPHRGAAWPSTAFLELDSSGNIAPNTWKHIFEGGTAEPQSVATPEEMVDMNNLKAHLVRSGQLVPDGRFVRTPASDQVKIPKGQRVFLEVDDNNNRIDESARAIDLYEGPQYQFVYVPPHFRGRVFLFIMLIWVFAAATGVGITIVPLVFGRMMFRLLIPDHIRTNDIYAFSIGVYILTTVAYTLLRSRVIYESVKAWAVSAARSFNGINMARRVWSGALRVGRIFYTYFFLFIVFPLMVSSFMELYAVVPLHQLMHSSLLMGDGGTQSPELNPRHSIRLIQGWTVGLLYLKLASRIVVLWFDDTRLAAAVRAVLRRGWLDPDVEVLTRAFVVPSLVLWPIATLAPLLVAKFTIVNGLADAAVVFSGAPLADKVPEQELYEAYLVLIYRLSFPLMAVGVVACLTLWSMLGVFRSWRVRIRDEAYLIGERLHNFGVANGPPKGRGTWRAGGTRL